ncbi:MAG: PIG-L family deacetylase [bacterium]|nr:PIG-L family deacetylase [bacterium]
MHVFLSPHFDDAVLSCGAYIRSLTAKGVNAIIMTVMGGNPPDPLPQSPLIDELHARWDVGENPVDIRKKEDVTAATALGALTATITIPDCVYRTHEGVALYQTGESLFGDIHPNDPAIEKLRLDDLTTETFIKAVYVPMGVGNHVDHQLVRDAGIRLHDQHPSFEVWFYEDYPYSSDAQKLADAQNSFRRPLESVTHKQKPSAMRAKYGAIACYESQISTFWATLKEMQQSVEAHMRVIGNGDLAERFWRIRD